MVRELMRSKHLHRLRRRCARILASAGARARRPSDDGRHLHASCRFCDIKTGRPAPLDWQEPNRIAQSVKAMNLRHVVITSVNRDGVPMAARDYRYGDPRIRQVQPGCSIEVLIPDFRASATR